MNLIVSRSAWVLLLTTALCWNLATGQVRNDGTATTGLATATNRFGFQLLRQLAKQGNDANTFYSPLSVMVALSMAYNGAGGATEREMRRALGFEQLDLDQLNQSSAALLKDLTREDAGLKLTIANSLWTRQGMTFKPGFLARNQEFYRADIAALDFDAPESVAVINNWVARSTNRKIPRIIDGLKPDDVLVLINAVYFKAAWASQFNPSRTSSDVFYLSGGARQKVSMMIQKEDFNAYSGDGVVAVSLPYTTYGAQMELFLPAAGDSITKLLQKFDYDSYRRWKQAFKGRAVTLKLPRVKLEYETELNSPLQALGMRAAFTRTADFSAMTSMAKLFISQVIHKATLDLDEKGTEASAVTSLVFKPTSAPPPLPPLDFIADRPFIVVITERNSDAILFMGVVMNPQPGTK